MQFDLFLPGNHLDNLVNLLVIVILAVEIVLPKPALLGQRALTVRASQAGAVPFSVGHFEQIPILDVQITRHANGDLFNFTDHHY